jgi:organic hydroperoxide reductase OsmC/OhrA
MTTFQTTMPVRLSPTSKTLEREVDLPPDGQTIAFGAHGEVARHYGMPAGSPELPTTLDYLVASVGGCLIGTFAGSLRRAKVPVGRTGLTATATGSVASDEDGVLRMRSIALDYELVLPEQFHAAAEDVHAVHASRCPNARSVAAAIDVVTRLRLTTPDAA